MEKDNASQRHIAVTGASSGLGLEIARIHLKRGARVSLFARRAEGMARLQSEFPDTARFSVVDVTDESAVREGFNQARAAFGPFDTVYANAGMGVGGPVLNQTTADFRKQLDINVFGVLHTFYAAAPDLVANRGRFAITGSVSSYWSFPTSVAYSMSKFAVRAFAEGLFCELGKQGVSVTLLSPGFVATEIRGPKDPVPRWLQMSSERAAHLSVRAVESRRRELVITLHGLFAYWLSRIAPGTVMQVLRLLSR